MAQGNPGIPALTESQISMLRRALRSSPTFVHLPDTHFETKFGAKQLEDHVRSRYERCVQFIVPWVARKIDLAHSSVVEIGCGTGSTTAAFAQTAEFVDGFDINDRCFPAARERLRILELENAALYAETPAEFVDRMRRKHPDGIDVLLLYAVMEHQMLDERLETLETWWPMLRPGGVLVVSDTPNRLVYCHGHTSQIPFFDMLPDKLALRFLDHSPREGFRSRMKEVAVQTPEKVTETLDRWGRGVSFHEFQAVLGPLDTLVVGDGFESEILACKPVVLMERLLLAYLEAECPEVPIGFARRSLDLILQKPIPDQAPARPDHDDVRLTSLRLVP